MELTNREWKAFEIGKLFKINAGKSKGLNHLTKVNKGGVNYLGATNSNNGVLAYVQKVKQMVHKGNAICFIRNGEGSMGYSVYKAEDFIATSDISVGYSDFLNKYVGLFITTLADNVRGKYNFGYKRSETRLEKEKILLPITSNGKPDYAFMESYMKQKETELLEQYEKQTLNFKNSIPLSEKHWKEFKVRDVFSVSTGSLLPKDILKKGKVARLTATNNNNGVFDFYANVEHKNYREVTNFISVSFLGSVFYHPYSASLDMKIHAIQIPNIELNRYIAEFLVFCLKRMASSFSYGDQLSSTDLPKKKILLPTNDNGQPDFVYMENYMKALEYEKLKQYLNYKKLTTN